MIVEQFLSEMKKLKIPDLDTLTEFALTAAILIELKSRSILPKKQSLEDLELLDSRDALISKMLRLKTFQNAAEYIELLIENNRYSFARPLIGDLGIQPLKAQIKQISPKSLVNALKGLINEPQEELFEISHVTPLPKISIEQAIEIIIERLKVVKTASFYELTSSLSSKIEVITFFLAILELYKQGILELDQIKAFADIKVTLLLPSYLTESTTS